MTRPFSSLSPRGQLRRLRPAVLACLEAHGIEPVRLQVVGRSFNTIFRVVDADDRAFTLRVSPELRIHHPGTEALEAAWLDDLSARDIPVVVPVRSRVGDPTVTVSGDGIGATRSASLFRWVPGRPMKDQPTDVRFAQMGRLLAEIHRAAPGFAADRSVRTWAMRDPLQFPIDDRLDELTGPNRAVARAAHARCVEAFEALWADPPHEPHLLHGDFTWANVLVSRRSAVAIDFQDVGWGFRIQDVAAALHPFDRTPLGPEHSAAFRRGYEAVLPWPAGDRVLFAALIAARRLMMLNLGLHVRRPGLEAHLAHHCERLTAWLENGAEAEARPRLG